jgi:rhodanese-related sulfurtransferase
LKLFPLVQAGADEDLIFLSEIPIAMNTNNTLRNISLIAFTFVLIVVLVNHFTTNQYGRSNRQVVQQLSDSGHFMNYHQLHAVSKGLTAGFQLVDLRTAEEFAQSHLPGAINTPYPELLSRDNMKILQRLNDIPVLYGSSEAQAQTAMMLLLAAGIDKQIMIIGGNYQTALQHAIQDFHPSWTHYREEKARFDYRRYFNGSTADPSVKPAGIIPAMDVNSRVGGGC